MTKPATFNKFGKIQRVQTDPKKFKIPSQLRIFKPENDEIDTLAQDNKKEMCDYLLRTQKNLTELKQKIYEVIDAIDEPHTITKIYQIEKDDGVNYNTAPSVFLETAYTLQSYDNQGMTDNRVQPYIDAGVRYAEFCDNNPKSLSEDQRRLNDVGKMVSAINNALSQVNRTKDYLDNNQFEIAGLAFSMIEGPLNCVISSSKGSKIVDASDSVFKDSINVFQKLFSNLAELVKKIREFFLGNEIKSSEEKQSRP